MTKARIRYNAAVEKRERIKAAIAAHEKTYCRDTMEERRNFTIPFENGTGHYDCSGRNPNFDPKALHLYRARYHELERELEKCNAEVRREHLRVQIIEAPLNLIRFVRSLFKRIEQETRPD